MSPRILARAVLLAAALGAACGRQPAPTGRPIVVVSVPPQAYVVKRIAGDLVDVQVMIPPGASPATYEPTMRQIRAVADAAVYVKVGHPNFPFERTWLEGLVRQSSGLTVVDGSAGVQRREGDPHVWVSPACVRVMARNIEAALAPLLPERREELRANLDRFLADVDALDAAIRVTLEGRQGKRFLVFHPAWGYFAEEYGLVQVSIEHDHKEPGPERLAVLIEHIRDEDVDVVFVQPQFSRQAADVVAREIGGVVVVADPLAYDWIDNLRQVADAFAEATK